MKIFNNNLNNNPKTIALRIKIADVGRKIYLPSFSKEWKNIIYSYNKNYLKNIPVNVVNINKIIESYFNLYFKNQKFVGYNKNILRRPYTWNPSRIRRKFLRRIYVSNAEIKHTNNKAIITLYTVNREKKTLKEKYLKINKKVSKNLIKRYFLLYKKNIAKIYEILNKYKDKYVFISEKIYKRKFIKYKLEYLNKFIRLKNLYLKKIWSIIINKYWKTYLKLLRKYDLLYSLNQYKFNKQILLPLLSNILNKIIEKKIEYNIINMKSIAYNTDLFTNALALKLKKKFFRYIKSMLSILNRASVPIIKEKKITEQGFHSASLCLTAATFKKKARLFLNKYKDLKIISNLRAPSASASAPKNNLDKLLGDSSNTEEIHNTIYNSIGYKNMGGLRIEVKGRLTKRYRADRSVYSLKWKGGLKNTDSSYKGLSVPYYRGNKNPNVSYSIATSKRRIGAFAVKGWISGKYYSTIAF